MCQIMEEVVTKVKKQNAITMLMDSDLPFEKIALYSNLPLGEVKKSPPNFVKQRNKFAG